MWWHDGLLIGQTYPNHIYLKQDSHRRNFAWRPNQHWTAWWPWSASALAWMLMPGSGKNGKNGTKGRWRSYSWMRTSARLGSLNIDRWDVSKTKLYRESVCDGYWNSLSLMWFALHSQHREEAFISQLEVIVKKKNTVEVKIEEQWMSEKEMRDELHWSSSLWHNEI